MLDFKENKTERLPKDFQIIPLNQESETEMIGIGLVLQKMDSPAGWGLIFLQDKLFYKAYLGCLFDKERRVLNWLEICVQQTYELHDAPVVGKIPLTNNILEKRWSRQVQAMEVLLKDSMFKILWESQSPLPGYINPLKGDCIYPKDPETNSYLQLCREEAILAEKQLPSFGDSLYRYLYIPAKGTESLFFPIGQNAPNNSFTGILSEFIPEINECIPFNPGAGFIMCKKYYPLDLELLMDILSQSPRSASLGQMKIFELFPQVRSVSHEYSQQETSGRLFCGAVGLNGIMAETFLLKLRLFYQLTTTVQKVISETKSPIFTLDLNSWKVNLLPAESSLPSLWATRPILTDPGESISIKISGTTQEYFVYTPTENSIFRPSIVSLPVSGDAMIRMRKIVTEFGQIVVEGTFYTNQRMDVNLLDLVWLRLALSHGTVELVVRLEADTALAHGEWRFRSLPYAWRDTVIQDLNVAEGVPLSHVPFKTIPHVNSPIDLYSLAVIAVRLFLVHQGTSLPVILDEVLSLAHQVAYQFDPQIPLVSRIKNLFSEDSRWANSLGPQHLINHEISAEKAFRYIPSSLWWQLLEVLIKMFPGIGPDSEFKNYGDLSFNTPELAFNNTIEKLSQLIKRTKPLVFSNWNQNRQIWDLIDAYMQE